MWIRPNRPELDATKVPTDIDIAWSAGIYEGEGTCRLCGRTKRGFMVSVVQKDPEILYRLRDWFGGNVRILSDNNVCSTWDACGDRARIFISLVYKFMSSRRKFQIDTTGAMDFLEGQHPEQLTIVQLQQKLLEYYSRDNAKKREHQRAQQAEIYKRLSADPNWRRKTNERNAEYRKNMTSEQKEASRKYQQEYYQNKKAQIANGSGITLVQHNSEDVA